MVEGYMSAEDLQALWRRTDEHGQRITDLTVEQRVQASKIESQEQRFERYLKEQADAKAQILEAVRGHQMRQGAKELITLVAPWVAAGIAVLALVWRVLGGGS